MSLAAMVERADRFMSNADYVSLLAKAGEHVSSIGPDALMEVVHGETAGQAPVGSLLGSVSATASPDRGMEPMAWAVGVAEAWEAVVGIPVALVRMAAGPIGDVGWLARFDDAAAVDAANAKLAASTSYAEKLASGAGLFSDGAQVYARRMA